MGFSFASCDLYRSSSPKPSRLISRCNSYTLTQIPLERSLTSRWLEGAGGLRPGLEPGPPGSRATRRAEAPVET